MKKLYLSMALILVLTFSTSYSQTITSTTSGGLWSSGDTWVGGVVPGNDNDVVINGPVQLDGINGPLHAMVYRLSSDLGDC